MVKKVILIFYFIINLSNILHANENFFEIGKVRYEEKKFEESKFLFQRSIVFNPKDSQSYLYLAKIYKNEKNGKEEEKNVNTALLLEPNNEEAMFMLINIELQKSNYSEVKELTKNFLVICSTLCKKETEIIELLNNIEPKNDSKQ